MHIGICGNIGSGKTTLASLLANKLDCPVFEEHVLDNPYLEFFYQDPKTWAFHSTLHFMTGSCADHHRIAQITSKALQDRPVCEQRAIFLEMKHDNGLLTDAQYETILAATDQLMQNTAPLDCILYLDASPELCMERIARRGNSYESPEQLPLSFLQDLNERYKVWSKAEGLQAAKRFITVDARVDFHDPMVLQNIISQL